MHDRLRRCSIGSCGTVSPCHSECADSTLRQPSRSWIADDHRPDHRHVRRMGVRRRVSSAPSRRSRNFAQNRGSAPQRCTRHGFRSGANARMVGTQQAICGIVHLPVPVRCQRNFRRQAADRRAGAGRDQERDPRQAHAGDRQGRRHGDPARLVQGRGAGAARPHRAPLADDRKAELRRRPQAGLLPLAGIPDRPAVHRRAEQYGPAAGVRGRARRSRRRARRSAQMRAGRGARQWRPRAARGLLHGEHGDAGDPRHRLRHPLRFRPVPPDHRAGLAAGISRRMAELRQPLGIPAAGSGLSRPFRRRRRACRRPAAATARSGIRRKPCRRSPTTPRSSAGAASTSTRCGCGRRARPIRCSSTSSTPATISAPPPRRRAPNRSANSSIRTTRARRAANCGCARNISSSRPRCRIWSSAISLPTGSCAAWPRRPRCSSTTPIRASPSPS